MITYANFQLYRINKPDGVISKTWHDDNLINKWVRFFIHQTMCLKHVEKKKILGRHNKLAKWLFNYFKKYRCSHLKCSIKTLLLKNILKANRKIPVLESVFNSECCETFKSTHFEEHMRTAASQDVFMKQRKVYSSPVLTLH